MFKNIYKYKAIGVLFLRLFWVKEKLFYLRTTIVEHLAHFTIETLENVHL
jgi:hypothetical protein